jgi:alkylation response protein AidB-like acyl-CoA dehydrogenase
MTTTLISMGWAAAESLMAVVRCRSAVGSGVDGGGQQAVADTLDIAEIRRMEMRRIGDGSAAVSRIL